MNPSETVRYSEIFLPLGSHKKKEERGIDIGLIDGFFCPCIALSHWARLGQAVEIGDRNPRSSRGIQPIGQLLNHITASGIGATHSDLAARQTAASAEVVAGGVRRSVRRTPRVERTTSSTTRQMSHANESHDVALGRVHAATRHKARPVSQSFHGDPVLCAGGVRGIPHEEGEARASYGWPENSALSVFAGGLS